MKPKEPEIYQKIKKKHGEREREREKERGTENLRVSLRPVKTVWKLIKFNEFDVLRNFARFPCWPKLFYKYNDQTMNFTSCKMYRSAYKRGILTSNPDESGINRGIINTDGSHLDEKFKILYYVRFIETLTS